MKPIELLDQAIRDAVFPGACFAYGLGSRTVRGAIGRFTYCPDDPATELSAVWDLASVSKVVATTTVAMRMVEAGKLDLDRPVAEILPEFGANGKAAITPRNLLTHDSGLIAFRPYHRTCTTPEEVLAAINAEGLTYPTGTKSVYSDLSMIVLAKAMERLSGRTLDAMASAEVFGPLGMADTTYRPEPSRCVPTEGVEPWRRDLRQIRGTSRRYGDGYWIQGEVHDPTACVLGGVAGHAGLFSTLDDLEKFVGFLLNGGIAEPATIAEFTRKQSDLSTRGLGWDTKSPEGSSAGSRFGPKSFGHTGYTGTSLWLDPERGMWAILLTNRVHPTAENTRLIGFRPAFHDAAAAELLD